MIDPSKLTQRNSKNIEYIICITLHKIKYQIYLLKSKLIMREIVIFCECTQSAANAHIHIQIGSRDYTKSITHNIK